MLLSDRPGRDGESEVGWYIDKKSRSTQQLPLAATEVALSGVLSEAYPGAIWHADEQELMDSSAETLPTGSETGTPPTDTDPKQQEGEPEENPAVPPSPTDNTEKEAASFEEFFQVQRSDLGGLGAFATRDLTRGQKILEERPLLRTTHFRLLPDYHNLSDAAKKAYLSLHDGENGDQFSKVERIKVLNS
jgi:hypothetical protein